MSESNTFLITLNDRRTNTSGTAINLRRNRLDHTAHRGSLLLSVGRLMHLVVSAVTTMMVSTLHSMLYQLLLLLLSNRLRVMVSTPIVDRRSELLLRLTTATPPITIDS